MNESLYNRQERIQAYLSGRLSDKEKKAFETEEAQNTELASEVQFYKRIHKTIAQKETFDFQERLESISQKVDLVPDLDTSVIDQALSNGKWWQNGWLWSTLIALFLGGIIALNKIDTAPDTELLLEMSKDMITPFENVIAYNPDENTAVSLGMTAYDKADYEQAASQLQRAAAGNPEIKFYLGISQLLHEEYSSAAQTLSTLQLKNTLFEDAANFYLALSYLQTQKVDEAKTLLLPLVSGSQFSNQAQQLLEAM